MSHTNLCAVLAEFSALLFFCSSKTWYTLIALGLTFATAQLQCMRMYYETICGKKNVRLCSECFWRWHFLQNFYWIFFDFFARTKREGDGDLSVLYRRPTVMSTEFVDVVLCTCGAWFSVAHQFVLSTFARCKSSVYLVSKFVCRDSGNEQLLLLWRMLCIRASSYCVACFRLQIKTALTWKRHTVPFC